MTMRARREGKIPEMANNKPWVPTKLGKIIAERQYTLKGRNRTKTFLLQVGCPRKDPTSSKKGPWACPILITGLQSKVFTHSFGEDSLQSLTLGLFHALRTLHSLAKERDVEIEYLGPQLPLVYDWWGLREAEILMKKHFNRHYPAKARGKKGAQGVRRAR